MLATKPERTFTQPIQLRPGVIPTPPMQYRVRILADTIISKVTGRNRLDEQLYKGELVYKGTVLDVMPKDFAMLRAGFKAERVDDNAPLHTVAAPVDPNAIEGRPARVLELIGNGLNSIADLANELRVSKGDIARIASKLIADGSIKLSDRGVYVLAKKV